MNTTMNVVENAMNVKKNAPYKGTRKVDIPSAPRKHREVIGCKVDFENEQICLTKKFMSAAQRYGTTEYFELADACSHHPDFKIKVHTIRVSEERKQNKGLTMAAMENHIKIVHSDRYEEYKKQVDHSMGYASPYTYLRRWFLNEFPDWKNYEQSAPENSEQGNE